MLRAETHFLAEKKRFSFFPKWLKLLSSWLLELAKAYVGEVLDELQYRISKAYRILEKKLEIYQHDQKKPSTDILSSRMKDFLDDIEILSKIPEGLHMAIDLLICFGEYSCCKVDGLGPLYGWDIDKCTILQQVDKKADKLLVEMLKQARKEDPNFKPSAQAARLKESIDYLKEYKITSYFPRSYQLMCSFT